MSHSITTESVTLSVADGGSMPGYVARPESGNGRGLIVIQEAFGVNHHIREVTERFGREGYLAIAPAMFHRTDPNFEGSYTNFDAIKPHFAAVTPEGVEDDVRAAFDWLTAQGCDKVASIGYCFGGRATWIANSILPLYAAVSYYGGGIAPDLADRAPKQNSPILLVWGGQDGHITPDKVRAAEDALREAGKPFANITFSEAGHGFFCDEREAYEPKSAAVAWPMTLAWLETYAA